MAKLFTVDVVTPEAIIWSGEVEMISARTTEGDIGILADHEPTMAALATGAVSIHHDGGVTTAGIHGGFLQIFRNHVTLLTDRAELTEGGLEEARVAAAALREAEEADGPYGETQAAVDFHRSLWAQSTAHMLELGHWERRRIHNLKYFTWVEQQQKDVEELNAQWYDHRTYWPQRWGLTDEYDALIRRFNERVGLAE